MARQQGEEQALKNVQSDGGGWIELLELDHEILDRLQEGARTQAYILDDLDDDDYSRHQMRERFKILNTIGAVEKLHDQTALYELKYDPRNCGHVDSADAGGDNQTNEEADT